MKMLCLGQLKPNAKTQSYNWGNWIKNKSGKFQMERQWEKKNM